MRETEVFIPNEHIIPDKEDFFEETESDEFSKSEPAIPSQKSICAYPAEWASNFGSDYYRHAQTQEMAAFAETGEWNTQAEGEVYTESSLQVADAEDIKVCIDQIIKEMKYRGGMVT